MFILLVSNLGSKHNDNVWQHKVASEICHATIVTRYSTAFIIASFFSLTQTHASIQSITVVPFVALRHMPDAQFFIDVELR